MSEQPTTPQSPLLSELSVIGYEQRLKEIRAEVSAPPVEAVAAPREGFWQRNQRNQRYWPVILIVMWMVVSTWMYVNPVAGGSVFELSDLQVLGPTELCSGESLVFLFNVEVKREGVYSIYMSTWRIEPVPETIIFSEIEPFVIGEKRTYKIRKEWAIPYLYKDPVTGKDIGLAPGRYTRDISVVALGLNTVSTPIQVNFTVLEDCPH